jgi:thiol peroxidase
VATINFQGKPIHTCGELPAIGTQAPDFRLCNRQLRDLSLKDFAGKRKLLSIVPSLDTPTCQTSTRKFNEKAAQIRNTEVLVISADLPFAQVRFCETDGIKNLSALSSFRSSFAQDYGLTLTDSLLAGLMARGIIILDENDRVIYQELVSEITAEPDYASALAVLA